MIQSCVELDIASRIVAFIKWKMCYWFVAKSNKCVFFSGLFVWHFGLILLLSFITHTYLVFSEMTFFFCYMWSPLPWRTMIVVSGSRKISLRIMYMRLQEANLKYQQAFNIFASMIKKKSIQIQIHQLQDTVSGVGVPKPLLGARI